MNRENRTLQAAKLIGAVLVVLIHGAFPEILGDVVSALVRFAVPLFFCVGGRYFAPVTQDGKMDLSPAVVRRRAEKRLKHLLRLTLTVYFFYTLYSLLTRLFAGETLASWAADRYAPGEWFIFSLFNSGKVVYDYTYTYDHLWFLFASIYVYAALFLLSPLVRKTYRLFTLLLLIALYGGILLQIYYPIRPFDISIRTWYMLRNWLLIGLPFTGLGIWSREGLLKKCRLASRPAGGILILAGTVLALAEMVRFEQREISVGALLIVFGILALADAEEADAAKEAHSEAGRGVWRRLTDILVFAGRELSANMYYWHVLLFAILIRFTLPLETMPLWFWLRPLVLLILSLCLALSLWYYKNRRDQHKQ